MLCVEQNEGEVVHWCRDGCHDGRFLEEAIFNMKQI